DEILARLRKHFDAHGFEKVEIVWHDGEKPARSDPSSEVARSVIECVKDLHGEPILWPFMQATGPMHPVVADLGVPTVLPVGVGRPDNRIHAPNENIHATDYVNAIRPMGRVWEGFGAGEWKSSPTISSRSSTTRTQASRTSRSSIRTCACPSAR